ncbi:hypothetical protein O1W71_12830 [Microbacterium sp. H37-C3]|uniref:hypothetical protein n=1 Tax=Microbacterium sp. H37-C3 TaxID=3004354 RepID=UPI0022AEF18B|nr:hypothetical protein [Microbacterium sp. H37-C3]MCZ4068558.1 hypothetical protein [Microbacterium sp. H37-C3]
MTASDPPTDGLAGLDFGARPHQRLTRADVDAAVLRSAGLGDLVDRLWHEGAAASNAARRSVTAHLRERFGARDPHSGVILRVVFVLLLLSVLPIGMLNGIRLGVENTVVPGGIVSVVVGIGALAAVAAAGGRPLGRPVALQSTLLAVLVIAAAAVAWVVTDGGIRMLYLLGAVIAAIAAIVVRLMRARGGSMTTDIDNGVELAHLDVAAEIAVERDRMTAELMRDLDGRTDVAELVRRRSAAIDKLRSRGGAMEADEPDTPPGGFIIHDQTMLWLPVSQRQRR